MNWTYTGPHWMRGHANAVVLARKRKKRWLRRCAVERVRSHRWLFLGVLFFMCLGAWQLGHWGGIATVWLLVKLLHLCKLKLAAIFFVVGKPGGGKSYYGVKQMVDELFASDRFIVTNIDLNLPEIRQFIHEEQSPKFDFETVGEGLDLVLGPLDINLNERVRVLNDDESSQFWLYEPGRDFVQRKTVKQGKRTFEVPDFEDRAKRGCLYIIDEVHTFFGAREWQQTGPDCTFFLSQHRKLRCDIVFITQHPDQVDKALRRLAQDYVQMRNLSREPVMGFRIGSIFRWSRSLNSPTGGNPRVFESGFLKLDASRYGKMYDTMAGVGIQGRVAPNVEAKGRSPWWLLLPVLLVLYLVFFGPRLVAGMGRKVVDHLVGNTLHAFKSGDVVKVNLPEHSADTNKPAAVAEAVPPTMPASVLPAVASSAENVSMIGYAYTGSRYAIMLSDGRLVHSTDASFQHVGEDGLMYAGKFYPRSVPVHDTNAAPVSTVSEWRGVHPTYAENNFPQVTPRYLLRVHSDGQEYERLVPLGGDRASQSQPETQPVEEPQPHHELAPMAPLQPVTIQPKNFTYRQQ